jgi:hypothetical protein
MWHTTKTSLLSAFEEFALAAFDAQLSAVDERPATAVHALDANLAQDISARQRNQTIGRK